MSMSSASMAHETEIYRHKVEKDDVALSIIARNAREEADHSRIYLAIINGLSAFVLVVKYLISLETVLSMSLSIVFTVVGFEQTKRDSQWDGGIMNWVLLSFAVITPMLASLHMAYKRRESALRHISTFRSTCTQIYYAHATWDWPLPGGKSGRAASSINWLNASDQTLEEIIQIGDALCRFLTLPTSSRARHTTTYGGKMEAAHLKKIANQLFKEVVARMGRITLGVEILKREGLPANEAIRMRNWEQIVMKELEDLEKLKMYRTPQALRSLSRLFSVCLPPFYAPYYAQLAREVDSLGAGIFFAIVASLVLTALFESMTQMEDPFVPYVTLDGIDVHRELREFLTSQLIGQRENVLFIGAKPFRNKDLLEHMSRRSFRRQESSRIMSAE